MLKVYWFKLSEIWQNAIVCTCFKIFFFVISFEVYVENFFNSWKIIILIKVINKCKFFLQFHCKQLVLEFKLKLNFICRNKKLEACVIKANLLQLFQIYFEFIHLTGYN